MSILSWLRNVWNKFKAFLKSIITIRVIEKDITIPEGYITAEPEKLKGITEQEFIDMVKLKYGDVFSFDWDSMGDIVITRTNIGNITDRDTHYFFEVVTVESWNDDGTPKSGKVLFEILVKIDTGRIALVKL